MCDACSSGFPVIGDIAWLFPDPRQALAEWRGRLGMLCEHLAAEAAAMRSAASVQLPADSVVSNNARCATGSNHVYVCMSNGFATVTRSPRTLSIRLA